MTDDIKQSSTPEPAKPEPAKPQPVNSKPASFFEWLGGESGIRQLVDTFYDVMDTDPRAAPIRAMHAADLTEAREKLTLFLTGWTGGPQHYIERYGHPMLRARHLPFPIDASARDQWMYCMIQAMHILGLQEDLMRRLAQQLYGVADFMRNQDVGG